MEDLNYIEKNRESWNSSTDYHVKSDFYDMDGFLKGNSSLNSIELNLLGDIAGKSVLHLQCHFGQDSISLARMGANVTGVDLSDRAIAKAKEIATQTGARAEFICCDLYDLPHHLHQQFDIVFTSYGTIGWLPDLEKWGQLISAFLKPGGKFVFVEFHPVVWMFDKDFNKIGYSYFNTGAIVETEAGTYADREAPIAQESVSWNHSLGEVLHGLLHNGLQLQSFQEFDYSPYNCFNETEEFEPKKFRIKHLQNKIPMLYALVATKP
ncbi:class I SAM-dependent methyltransferase [Pontibacter sp. 13R65]|uniref:class I SAM-dependent methyltransferase n=1 Tax=Pontibacter sp. 13R65 TaxID=3127458 RepID=UPI00301D8BBB